MCYINIIKHNIDYITIEYTARLINRYDGTQIVRKAALTTYNIYKYVESIVKLNTKTITNYNVYNKLVNKNTELKSNTNVNTKFIKVYYNSSNINLDNNGTTTIIENFTQNISKYGGTYLFTFKNSDNSFVNFVDSTSYVMKFTDDLGKSTEINCTYSNNMNMTNGQLEFYITPSNAQKMQKITDKRFAIVSKNHKLHLGYLRQYLALTANLHHTPHRHLAEASSTLSMPDLGNTRPSAILTLILLLIVRYLKPTLRQGLALYIIFSS